MLCRSLQGRRSSQRLGVHGGEDAVEARQRPGLHALHPKGIEQEGRFCHRDILSKTKSV